MADQFRPIHLHCFGGLFRKKKKKAILDNLIDDTSTHKGILLQVYLALNNV